MESNFKGFMVEYIEWNKNTKADDLAKAATRNIPMLTDVFFKYLRPLLLKQFRQSPGSSISSKGKTGELQ
jgi:hypothetical protein